MEPRTERQINLASEFRSTALSRHLSRLAISADRLTSKDLVLRMLELPDHIL